MLRYFVRVGCLLLCGDWIIMLKSSFISRTFFPLRFQFITHKSLTIRHYIKCATEKGLKMPSILTPFRGKFASTRLERRRDFTFEYLNQLKEQISGVKPNTRIWLYRLSIPALVRALIFIFYGRAEITTPWGPHNLYSCATGVLLVVSWTEGWHD
jgi:hypothetical protein